MITKEEIKKILSSYNLETNQYGPTIYENNNELGITLDIKDSLFSFLTRKFIFNTPTELEDFLKIKDISDVVYDSIKTTIIIMISI